MQLETIMTHPDGSICVLFDANVYRLSALKKAAYKFTDRASVLISEPETGKTQVRFSFAADKDPEYREKVVHDFCNEVLDQDLRETIAAETEATRNLILAQAFSKTSLLEG